MKKVTRVISVLLVGAMLFSLTACGGSTTEGNPSEVDGVEIPEGVQGEIKVAVIKNLGSDEHSAQILAAAVSEGESLGFTVDTFVTADDAAFADKFEEVLINGYDGIFYTHGQTNITELVEKANEQGIPCVGFDSPTTPIELDNVAMTSQDDEAMARESLQALVDAFPGETPKVVKMLINGYPAQENRDAVWNEFVEAGLIEEVTNVAEVGDWTNVSGLNADAIGSVLANYEEGTIDAIWAAWDSFATGAHIALEENNRQEILIFSVDVANADLQNMQEENSSWTMTAAADASAVGKLNMRILALMLAGEDYEKEYILPVTSIYQADLLEAGGDVTVETLGDVYDTYGESDDFLTEWMTALKSYNEE